MEESLERFRYRWENSIKIGLDEVGWAPGGDAAGSG
jgi:hypothetical protein